MASPQGGRKEWMAVLARAETAMLRELLAGVGDRPGYTMIQPPEVGLVMVRGRIGGDGAAFNLGEMTVTRCTIVDGQGRQGIGYVGGRDRDLAELAAIGDLLLQDEGRCGDVFAQVIVPLKARQREKRAEVARKAAATRVEFSNLAVKR